MLLNYFIDLVLSREAQRAGPAAERPHVYSARRQRPVEMAAARAAGTVDGIGDIAAGLADRTTLAEALGALEGRSGGAHDAELALAAAPALVSAMTTLAAAGPEEPAEWPEAFQRVALMLVDILEGTPVGAERDAVFGAAWGEGRLAAHDSALQARFEAPGCTLTRADAVCYACSRAAVWGVANGRSGSTPFEAAGMTMMEFFTQFNVSNPMRQEDVSLRMAMLALEIVREQQVPDGAAHGAWMIFENILDHHHHNFLAESDVFSLVAAQLSAIGGPADCLVRLSFARASCLATGSHADISCAARRASRAVRVL
jgi:hypothetical protein